MSLYVTDTHPLVWYTTETYRKLSPKALRAFQRASRGEVLIWVPAMAIWEAGLLQRIRRVRLKPSFRDWAETLVTQRVFALAPMDLDTVQSSLEFEPNSDLFDVAIVATAKKSFR